MQSEYRRDYNRNYLILRGQMEPEEDSYQVRMLLANVIPGLLSCRMQRVDGEPCFFYDITSRQAVSVCYEKKKPGWEDLEMLFTGIVHAADQMAEFLMNADQICLEPEYLFLDLEKKQLYFCCFPGRETGFREQFRHFLEYLLPKIDHQDSLAVSIGYGVYRKAMEEEFCMEQVIEELYTAKEKPEKIGNRIRHREKEREDHQEENGWENVPDPAETADTRREERLNPEDWAMPGEDPEKASEKTFREPKGKIVLFRKGSAALLLLMSLLLIGLSIARGMGYFPELDAEVLLAGVFVTGSGGIFVGFLWERRERRRREPTLPLKKEKGFGKKKEVGRGIDPGICMDSEGKTMLIRKEQKEPEEKSEGDMAKPSRPVGVTEDLLRPSIPREPFLKNTVPGDLKEIMLREELTVIGKLPAASDVVIDVPSVSRIHAKILRRDGEYSVTDLNSRNGTYVNGVILEAGEERRIRNGDEIGFGAVRYCFDDPFAEEDISQLSAVFVNA